MKAANQTNVRSTGVSSPKVSRPIALAVSVSAAAVSGTDHHLQRLNAADPIGVCISFPHAPSNLSSRSTGSVALCRAS